MAARVGGRRYIATVDPSCRCRRPGSVRATPCDLDKVRHAALLVRCTGYAYGGSADQRIVDRRLMRGSSLPGASPSSAARNPAERDERRAGHAHVAANPHYCSTHNAVIVTAGIAEALVRLAPGQRERIVANRERFLAELKTRRAQWTELLAPYAGVKLVAYHNSWPYFARRFRLDIVDFIEPKPGVAPSPPISPCLTPQAAMRSCACHPADPQSRTTLRSSRAKARVPPCCSHVGRRVPGTKDYFALFDHNVGRGPAMARKHRRNGDALSFPVPCAASSFVLNPTPISSSIAASNIVFADLAPPIVALGRPSLRPPDDAPRSRSGRLRLLFTATRGAAPDRACPLLTGVLSHLYVVATAARDCRRIASPHGAET